MSDVLFSADKRSFDQLDFIASPVFVLVPDAQGVPRYAAFNANARAASGRPLSDYIGNTAKDVYPGAFGNTAFQRHCEVTKSGKPMTYQLDLPIGGQNRSIRTTLLPELDANGQIMQLFGTSVDLTQDRDTREAQVSYETLATEMEQYVAMAAHDLRAPMRNMALLADMISDGFVDQGDGKAELIALLDDVAQKSMALTADVLNHAQSMDTAKSLSKFNFAALCRDICDVLDPFEQHRFTYTSADVAGDRTAFQIAIRNVIENAMKHGDREQLKIDITLQRGEHGMLNMIITDTGVGFPDAALAFINGGHFRPDSGYGMLGVRRMVQARGGAMTAQNMKDGTGAVICLSMPGTWLGATNSLGDLVMDWSSDKRKAEPRRA